MRDFLNIGSTPAGEDCAQVGSPDYYEKGKKECLAFKHQLERAFPDGRFTIKTFPHDFGSYMEVVAWFDDDYPDSPQTQAAFAAEACTPENWDEEAKKELSL